MACLGFLAAALGGVAAAQDAASTLSRCADRAAVIVQARALAATDPDPAHHRVRFAVELALRGTPGPFLSLQEPAGRCCGRALHGTAIGSSYLLFVDDNGHLVGGSRGMEPADPGLLAHVRSLLQTGRQDRPALLAAALEHRHRRVRRDAALALAFEPALPGAGTGVREGIRRAAHRLLLDGDTALSGLLTAARRLGDRELAHLLLDDYLAGRGDRLQGLLLAELPLLDGAGLGRRLGAELPEDPAARLRAVRLLGGIEDPAAAAALRRALRGTGAAREEAAVILLRRGTATTELARILPAEVLTRVEDRAAGPRFRHVRPGGSR